VENHKDKQPNISKCEAMQPLQGKILFNTLLALKLIMQFMSGGDMITLMKKKSLARQAWPCGLIVKLLNCTIILY